jgi:hypothetical protein
MIDNTPSKSAVIKRAAKIVLSLCLVAAVLAGVWFGVQNAGKKLKQNGLESTERNLRRGAVECYALEGRYPESLEYLTEHYNITIDESKYAVYYTVFASNIMPDITVVAK